MNLLLSIFILFLFSLANSKELTYSVTKEGLYYYGITDIPYTGKILGLTKSFVKGKKEGQHIKYYEMAIFLASLISKVGYLMVNG